MTDTDYTDDLTLLANTPTQAKSQLDSVKQAEWGICINVIANKIDFVSFKQEGAIFKWQIDKIRKQDYKLRQHNLIYWNWCQHAPDESVKCY